MSYRRVSFASATPAMRSRSYAGRHSVYRSNEKPAMNEENQAYANRIRLALHVDNPHSHTDAWARTTLADLLMSLESFGHFASDRQRDFALSLCVRLETGETGRPAAPAPVDLGGDFAPMIEIFNRALGAVKHPKISLRTIDGLDIELTVAGPGAKAPGTINVATPGGFGNNTWFGRIDREGKFQGSRSGAPASVMAILRDFAADPVATVRDYGHATGRCSMCRIKLTDPKSVRLGMGPVCAKRFFAVEC